jgi:hypothetical protein
MSAGGAAPAGSSRMSRLDPFCLPVSFPAVDAGADRRVRLVELHRERVIMRREVSGIRMAVSLPVAMFLGVAIRMIPPETSFDGAIAVTLEHRDPALSVPLITAVDGADVLADWQLWARILRLPLLVCDGEGAFRKPFDCLGLVRVAKTQPRRRRQTAMHERRPRILLRRRPGRDGQPASVHRGEREIIARN